jgi:drug/metabolite transporter (DMT)-like permease
MIGAFLTTVFFSLSSIAANRSIRAVGQTRANLGRLTVAFVVLGIWTCLLPWLGIQGLGGNQLQSSGLLFFIVSGAVGMGFGDLAVFAGLPMLGARLMVVITQCLAAPIAAVAEWLWLGTKMTPAQVLWSSLILAGVALAVSPSRSHPPRVRVRPLGVVMGILAATGQGLGAVLSRKAYELCRLAHESIDGMSATFARILGGIVITVGALALHAAWKRRRETAEPAPESNTTALAEVAEAAQAGRQHGTLAAPKGWRRWRWTLANGLSGPVLGVSCYQWALATTASGVILPIVATTPLMAIPLSYWIDHEKPTRRSFIGTAVAVIGAVCLAIAK